MAEFPYQKLQYVQKDTKNYDKESIQVIFAQKLKTLLSLIIEMLGKGG